MGEVGSSTTWPVMVAILGRDVLLSFGFQCSCLETKREVEKQKDVSMDAAVLAFICIITTAAGT